MTSTEVMRQACGRHIGYIPQTVWEHATAPLCWGFAIKLQKIPGKLTAYFKRELIKEARKAKFCDAAGLYYLELTDGTFIEVEY